MSAPETSPRRASQGLRARLSFAVIVLFAFTAAWGEFTAARHRLRDETPGYNAVNLAERYRPPLSRVADAEGRSSLDLMWSEIL